MTLFADTQGHFSTDVVIGVQRLRMLVDTGATTCAFTYEDAERAGLRVNERDFRVPVQTANGIVMAAPIRIPEMRIGTISVQGVDSMVMPRGRLSTSLLGMSFLKRLNEFSMNGGRLSLRG
jgi:aspartyl protease family protein